MVAGHLYAFTPLPKGCFWAPVKKLKAHKKFCRTKTFTAKVLYIMSKTTCQSDFRWLRNLLRKVCCLFICLSALTHPCNVLIKSNITRKRFYAGYSNLEHWSYLMPCTIRPDMTLIAMSGHVSAAIL